MSSVLSHGSHAAPASRPRSTTIVVSQGCADDKIAIDLQLDDQLASKLLAALPAARRVLVLGRLPQALADAHRRQHGSTWQAVAPTRGAIDAMPSDTPHHDLVVCPDLLALDDPLAVLSTVAARCSPDVQLLACARNAARLSGIEDLVEGDLSSDGDAHHRTTVRQASPASIYKLLMDAGWMPHLAGHTRAPAGRAEIAAAATLIADVLNVPRATAARTLGIDQLIVQAQRCFADLPQSTEPRQATFSVVVPTTRERQLRLNVGLSPGLKEVDARIVSCRDATSPAEALARSLPHCEQDWVLLCHQDVYFPRGFGQRLNALLAEIPPEQRDSTLIGFVGMGVDEASQSFQPAGFVIDRLHRADHPANERAVSIDELALVVSRHSIHRIDPQLGWHLWATDLCLQAICRHRVFPRLVRLPLFHNSLNDYTLPAAFYDSAERLLAKHADFGPVPTLCGTLDAAFLARRPVAERSGKTATELPPGSAERLENHNFLMLDAVDAAVGRCLAQGDPQEALARIVAGVHHSYLKPEFCHRGLYLPQLDRRLEQLAALLPVEPAPSGSSRLDGGTLLIATELYELGGHSRALLDVSHEVDRPLLVLTDLFDTYAKQPEQAKALKERFRHADVVVLPPGSYWDKCGMLRRAVDAMRPAAILYFAHHQDPIPFVGTLGTAGPRKLFMHHADHNASLGCTLAELRHVDLSEGVRELCARRLGGDPDWLPLYVEDAGVKRFELLPGSACSVVTSGHPAKFARSGPIALQHIVAATLTSVDGKHFHIGPLDTAWVAEIRARLQHLGIAAERFVPLGLVPSVWQRLKALDAAIYIGSAPQGGGRVAIEAQGCGYPLAYFENAEHTSLPANYPLYASRELKWSSPAELGALLPRIAAGHAQYSRAARALYETGYSRQAFRNALKRLLQT